MIDAYDPKVYTEKAMCLRFALDAGLSEEDAEKACCTCSDRSILEMDVQPSKNVSVNVSDVFPNLKFAEDDQPKIEGRQPENFEKCIITVMQVRNVAEPEATRVCHILFNDPMFRHAMAVGDSWTIAEALHNYSLENDPKWATYRERQSLEKRRAEAAITEEMQKLKDKDKRYKLMSDRDLRAVAIQNLVVEREKLQREMTRENRDAEMMTVGNLYGKTKAQIIKEDSENAPSDSRSTVGNLYGKSHKEIVEEDKAQADQEEELKKLKRKAAKGER